MRTNLFYEANVGVKNKCGIAVKLRFERPITVILLFLVTSLSAFCQPPTDSLMLRNRVKEIRVFNEQDDTACIIRYNKNGKIIYRFDHDFEGASFLTTSRSWYYNESGRVIKTSSTHSNLPDSFVWVYDYDNRGNKIATRSATGEMIFQYFYDDSNFLVKELHYKDGKEIEQTTTHEKSDNGKKIVSVNKGSFIKNRITTSYFDDLGNNIKTESFDGSEINFITEYIFEGRKRIKKIEHPGFGGHYVYDSKGNLIRANGFKIEDGIEKEISYEQYSYNQNGLIKTYQENKFHRGELRKFRYEYEYYN